MEIIKKLSCYCKNDIAINKKMIETMNEEIDFDEILLLRAIIHDEIQIIRLCQEEISGKET